MKPATLKNRRGESAFAFVTFLEGLIEKVWRRYSDQMMNHLDHRAKERRAPPLTEHELDAMIPF